MIEKNITINILPQDPMAWLFIAGAVILTTLFASPALPNKEREKTHRIEMMLCRGITNAEDIAIIEGSLDPNKP